MKKRFILTAAFMLALSVQAQQQTKSAFMTTNRIQGNVHRLPYAPRLRPQAGEMPYDTLLVTSMGKIAYSSSDAEKTQTDSTYVIYDECGRRKFLVTSSEVTRYTYETGPHNMWTLRIIENALWSGENGLVPTEAELNTLAYTALSKEEREINEDKQMISQTIYRYENEEWILTRRVRYDYSHAYRDENGELRTGHAIEVVDTDDGSAYTYQWFEPGRQYVQVLYKSNYQKDETTFAADSYTVKEYASSQGDGNYDILRGESTYYFAAGYEVGYKTNGSGERNRLTLTDNGFTLVWQEWDADKNDWTDLSKSDFRNCSIDDIKLKSLNNGQECRSLEKGHSGEVDYYTFSEDGGLTLTEKHVAVALSDNAWKQQIEYVTYGEKSELLLFLLEAGESSGDERWEQGVMNPDGSYVVDCDGNGLYEFYSADCKFLRRVKKSTGRWTCPANGNLTLTYPVFSEQQGDEWKQLREISISEFENDEFYDNRVVYSYDEQGRPVSEILYLSEKGIESIHRKTVYEYTDNGYKQTVYEEDYVNGQWQLLLEETKEHTLLADGTVRYETFDYSGDYGSRTEIKPDGLQLTYTYNESKEEFELSSQSAVTGMREVLPDGTEVLVDYEMGEDGQTPVPARKKETREVTEGYLTESMNARYEWDKAGNRWRGTNKEMSAHLDIPDFYHIPGDPLESYDDEFLSDGADKEIYLQDISESAYTAADWDEEKQSWTEMPERLITLDMPDEHTCMITITKPEGTDLVTTDLTYKTDSDKRLLKEAKDMTRKSADGTRKEFNHYDYTYSANGYLQSKTDEWGWNEDINTASVNYYYTLTSILPTAVEQAKADEAGIRVENGQILSVNPDETLRLYSLDGKQVAMGRGIVLPPAKGIYVVRSAKGGCKVMVK